MKARRVEPRVLFVLTTAHVGVMALIGIMFILSAFVLHTYLEVHDPQDGWTKLTIYGSDREKIALPRLQRVQHYIYSLDGKSPGYDGQFYAQMAIDPSLRDPAFDRALDEPIYRARRIGLPVVAFCLGWGKPRRIVEAYALSNLLFWLVLLAAVSMLLKPWTPQQLFCLSAAMVSEGVLVSMERSLTDLPATAMIFVGAVIGSWGGYAALAAAGLTRETSVLAAVGFLEPWRVKDWKRTLGLLSMAVVPLLVWVVYVRHRFGLNQTAIGGGNFSWPFQAMARRVVEAINAVADHVRLRHGASPRWLYSNHSTHEVEVIAGIVFQGLYFVLRPDWRSPLWRTGVLYAALGSVLGVAVWEQTSAAARVLLPMTICFYVLLARENAWWFWPFFIGGSLSVPGSIYDFWTF